MKQTAVEWLIEKLKSQGLLIGEPNNLVAVREAKQIEKQQIINACINTTQDCFKSAMNYMGQEIVFTEQDLINQKNEAEQYYNETFKNK